MDFIDYKILGEKDNSHFWYKARLNLIKRILNQLIPDKNATILNIGCGVGMEMETLKHYGCLRGTDINEEAVSIASKQGYDVFAADIENYTLEENKYDVITIFDVLEHLSDDKQAVENIYNALKPGGYFIFTVPAMSWLFSTHDIAMGHKKRYNKNEVKSIFSPNKFNNLNVYYWNSLLFPLEMIFRLFKNFVNKLSKAKNHSSDTTASFGFINNIFEKILNFENRCLFQSRFVPFGLTIYGWAAKTKK